MLAQLLGCPASNTQVDARFADPSVIGPDAGPAVAPSGGTTVVTAGDAADVALAFAGVSPLYQGYFSTESWVGPLAQDLGRCFDGLVEVVISYDSEDHIGRILVQADRSDFRCAPTAGAQGLAVSPLRPIGQALARYRDTIANARDLRIGSFRIGVRIVRGARQCDLYWAGQFPPDGTTMSPCVTLQGHEICLGDRHQGVDTIAWPEGDAGDVLRVCVRG